MVRGAFWLIRGAGLRSSLQVVEQNLQHLQRFISQEQNAKIETITCKIAEEQFALCKEAVG